uniref:Uncharacterized protein n=1 Tax=Nelumbo nucifera TaxID=4432 RepID=A0A822XKU5_NELNU|nr:TPA_asm: hypothetical protein HUJ06_022443 [Nelumbo nucifera]
MRYSTFPLVSYVFNKFTETVRCSVKTTVELFDSQKHHEDLQASSPLLLP